MGALLVVAAIVLLGGATAVGLDHVYSHDRRRTWRDAAQRHRLGGFVESRSFAHRETLTAHADDLSVRFETYARSKDDAGTRVAIEVQGGVLAGLSLRPEDFSSAMEKRFGVSREVEIGDKGFDDTFYIGGSPALVLALLDAATRRRLLTLLLQLDPAGRLEIADGELRAEFPERVYGYLGSVLPRLLGLMLETARGLPNQVKLLPRLVDNARHDTEPGVRLRNLLVLMREFGEDPLTQETLRAACADPSPEIRLRAASALGAEQRQVLLDIVDDPAADDTCAAHAVYALGSDLAIERTIPLLERALRLRHFGTAHACVDTLGRTDSRAARQRLSRVIWHEEAELSVSAARALGRRADPGAEPLLIHALQHAADGVRTAVAEALARAGSVAAVLPLKEAAERHRDAAFLRAARQAIAHIQSRAAGASPGQLSMTTVEAGRLSIADSDRGRLSLADDRAGNLSVHQGAAARPPEGRG
jgi:hypothetical protein